MGKTLRHSHHHRHHNNKNNNNDDDENNEDADDALLLETSDDDSDIIRFRLFLSKLLLGIGTLLKWVRGLMVT